MTVRLAGHGITRLAQDGSFAAATPPAFEHCPPRARGLVGGVLIGAFAMSYIAASLLVLLLLELLPHEGAASAYATWGWRIPFALVSCPLYLALAGGAVSATAGVAAVATAVVASSMAGWGVVPPYLTERFPTAVRSSGFGLGYTLAVVLPSLFSVWMWALGHVMPYRYTQVVLVGLGGVFVAAGAWAGPETSRVDLAGQTTQEQPLTRPRRPRRPARR